MNYNEMPLGELLGGKGYVRGPFGSALKRGELKSVGVPVYEQQHAITGTRDFRYFIDEEKHKDLERFTVQANDLIISCSGTVGRISIIKDDDPKGIISQALLILRPQTDKIRPYYLYYFLTSTRGFRELINASHGAVQQNIAPRNIVEKIPVPLPDIDQQDGIVAILRELDDKIELNQRMNETLEAMARALFKSWFVDFDPVRAKAEGREPEGMDAATAALFPAAFNDDGLPEGWVVQDVSEAIYLNPMEKLSKGMIAPYLDMAALPTQGIWPDVPILREFSSGSKFRNGDTLLARITPCLENGKTAYIDCLEQDQICWGSTEFIVMRAKAPLPREYVYLLARDSAFREHAIQSMTGTSGRQRVQTDSLGRFKVCVPSEKVALCFGEIVEPLFNQIKANCLQQNTLSQTRDALLPKLISGELRIDEAQERVREAV